MDTHSSPAAASEPLPAFGSPCTAIAPHKPADEAGRLPLPQWADNLEACLLLSAILADPPAVRLCESHLGARHQEYAGKDAARLRGLFRRGADEITAREMAAYKAGLPHAHLTAELQAWFLQERPDALIARLLRESVQ